jgi:hypothetical protein
MPVLNIILDGDNCWPDLQDRKIYHHTGPISVAALPGGMESGKTSVSIRIDLSDGSTVIAETSLQLFASAAKAFLARYGE